MKPDGDGVLRGLAQVPPVPDTLYPAIEGRIRSGRRKRLLRSALALAACAVLAAGALSFYVRDLVGPPAVVQDVEVDPAVQELMEIRDFLHGNDVEEEVGLYAIAELDI